MAKQESKEYYHLLPDSSIHKLDHIYDLVQDLYTEGQDLYETLGYHYIDTADLKDNPDAYFAACDLITHAKDEMYTVIKHASEYKSLYKDTIMAVLNAVPHAPFQKYPGYLQGIRLNPRFVQVNVSYMPHFGWITHFDELFCRYGRLHLDRPIGETRIIFANLDRAKPGEWSLFLINGDPNYCQPIDYTKGKQHDKTN